MKNEDRVAESAKAFLLLQDRVLQADPEISLLREQQAIAVAMARNAADSDDPLGQVMAFKTMVYAGIVPSADVLIGVAESIDRYLSAAGALKLDQAFNLAGVKKRGHPVVAHERDARWSLILDAVYRRRQPPEDDKSRADWKKPSIEAAAASFIADQADVAALLNVSPDAELTEAAIKKRYTDSRYEAWRDRMERAPAAKPAANRKRPGTK